MPCSDTCACIGEPFECLAALHPKEWARFRTYCAGTDPVSRQHVRDRSEIGWTPPSATVTPPPDRAAEMRGRRESPRAAPTPRPKVPATPPRPARPVPASIPLAGDLVAALTARIGADRAAEWVAAKLGKECGCAERRARLNRLDRAVRKFLGAGG